MGCEVSLEYARAQIVCVPRPIRLNPGVGMGAALDLSSSRYGQAGRGKEKCRMWVSKVSQIIGSSPTSFEDAAQSVLTRANRTLRGITGFAVVEKRLKIDENGIAEYRVHLHLDFDMAPWTETHW